MSDCNVNELMQAASPWMGMSPDQRIAAQAELLCRIYNNGSGISGFTPGSVIFAGSDGRAAQDNTNFYWNDTSNYLQIGPRSAFPSDPGTLGLQLVLGVDVSGGTGTKAQQYTYLTTSSGTQTIVGQALGITSSGTATPGQLVGYSTTITNSGGNNPLAAGMLFNVTSTAGTVTTAAGFTGTVSVTGGTATTAQGAQMLVSIGASGTATEARGFLSQIAGSGTIGTLYGGRISVTANGTITTEYGLYIATATGGTITTRNGMFLECRNAADIGFTIKEAGSHTGDPFRITNSSNTILLKVDSGGQIWLNNAAVAETPTATHTLKIKDSGGTEYRVLCLV